MYKLTKRKFSVFIFFSLSAHLVKYD